jgi:acyl-CoA synthetase (AMP-forming)/AMP-acid ligase II
VTLADLLFQHPFADDEPLLHGPHDRLTAGSARAAAVTLQEQLRALGVQPQDAVAVQLPSSPAAIVAMFGVWRAGAVFVPVNPRLPKAEVEHVLDATRPAAMLDEAGLHALENPMHYAADVAFVTWTSGTTGAPKPVLHTHANYLELLDRVLAPLRGKQSGSTPRRPTPNLVPVSLALNAGIYNVLFGLRAGAAIVVMDGFSTVEFARLVDEFSIASTVLPPAALTMLADDPDVVDLRPLKYVRSITAPLSPLQARRFTEKFGVVVLNGYGQAELGEVIGWTAADAREHPDKVGAVGRPHPGVEIRLADVDGDVGRLLVRPPAAAVGIDPSRVDADGFVDTGDFARIDEDGFVWIEGRVSDVINRGGNKIFPEQVEEVLRLAPGVVDAAVVGAPDDRLGEVPVAFLITADGGPGDDALAALCREHLAPYKVPVAFRRVDAFPRSDIGKVLRRELVRGLAGAS